jgi:Phospholipase_D-nuclease N-terminal
LDILSAVFGLAAIGLILFIGGIAIGLSLIVVLGFATLIFIVALWVVVVLRLFRNTMMTKSEKGFWFLVITFVPIVGPVAYLLYKPQNRIKF